MKDLGGIIRSARERKELFLRQAAAALDLDSGILSKFETGKRKPSKEQVIRLAKFYELNEEELLIAWLSDKITYELQEEKGLAEKVLKVAEEKLKYLKKEDGKGK